MGVQLRRRSGCHPRNRSFDSQDDHWAKVRVLMQESYSSCNTKGLGRTVRYSFLASFRFAILARLASQAPPKSANISKGCQRIRDQQSSHAQAAESPLTQACPQTGFALIAQGC